MEKCSTLSEAVAEPVVRRPVYLTTAPVLDDDLRLKNGNYFLGPQPDGEKGTSVYEDDIEEEAAASSETTPVKAGDDERVGTRKGERAVRKKPKYDPADYILPLLKKKKRSEIMAEKTKAPKKKGRPLKTKKQPCEAVCRNQKPVAARPEEPAPETKATVCAVCDSACKTGDRSVTCCTCNATRHESCSGSTSDARFCPECDASRVKTSSAVVCQLESSKVTCAVCGESDDGRGDAWPRGEWRCSKCSGGVPLPASVLGVKVKEEAVEYEALNCKDEEGGSTSIGDEEMKEALPKPIKTEPLSEDEGEGEEQAAETEATAASVKAEVDDDPYPGYPVDPTIPDASAWTSDDVYEYFCRYFKREVAAAFEEQDIDGQSLLLMGRADVLTGLGLKLGVALKILYHVRKLQLRRSDLRLLWAT